MEVLRVAKCTLNAQAGAHTFDQALDQTIGSPLSSREGHLSDFQMSITQDEILDGHLW